MFKKGKIGLKDYGEFFIIHYRIKKRNINQKIYKIENIKEQISEIEKHSLIILNKIDGDGPETIQTKDFDHFKHIGSISSDKFEQGEARFTALTVDNNLPFARIMQVRIDGYTDTKNSPEIYDVQFIYDQVER